MPNDPWYVCLPPCETRIPCGQGLHVVRWEAGEIRLPGHADPEAELVLAALGGEKARCVEVAQTWARHASDLTVLGVGPRSRADEIAVGWDDVDAVARADQPGGWTGHGPVASGPPGHGPMRLASPLPAAAMARAQARYQQAQQDAEQATQRRSDMLSLLALGHAFQVRLTGQVAAAHADRVGGEEGRGIRPALTAALAGRLAPAVEAWLGLDPEQVAVSLHHGPGWGSAELTGRGERPRGGWPDARAPAGTEQRRLRVSLPAGWLSRVWACGLALAGRHLVVAVERGGWPEARVLALRAPGTEPVRLDVHAREDGPAGADDEPHWEI